MSIRALAWAQTIRTGHYTRKLVLIALADRFNEGEDAAWPSIGWLERTTELSRRTIQRALRDLEEQGLIIPCGRAGTDTRYQTNRYRLAVDNPTVQGRHADTRDVLGASTTTLRGVTDDVQGRHSDTQTNREPLGNRAHSTRRIRRPVDNLTRPVVPSPEETLRMLEEERT